MLLGGVAIVIYLGDFLQFKPTVSGISFLSDLLALEDQAGEGEEGSGNEGQGEGGGRERRKVMIVA